MYKYVVRIFLFCAIISQVAILVDEYLRSSALTLIFQAAAFLFIIIHYSARVDKSLEKETDKNLAEYTSICLLFIFAFLKNDKAMSAYSEIKADADKVAYISKSMEIAMAEYFERKNKEKTESE